MKKWLLILGMITCMLGLTACGQQNKEADDLMSDQEARDYVESVATVVSQVVNQQGEESYIAMVEQNGVDGTVFENAFASWKSASEDMGNYVEVAKVTNNSVVVEEYQGCFGLATYNIDIFNTRNFFLFSVSTIITNIKTKRTTVIVFFNMLYINTTAFKRIYSIPICILNDICNSSFYTEVLYSEHII